MTTLNKKSNNEMVPSKSFESSGMQFPLDISPFKDEFEQYQKNLAKFPFIVKGENGLKFQSEINFILS